MFGMALLHKFTSYSDYLDKRIINFIRFEYLKKLIGKG